MLSDKPVISDQMYKGLQVTLEIVRDKMGTRKGTEKLEQQISAAMNSDNQSVQELYKVLQSLLNEAETLTGLFNDDSESAWWADAFANQVRDAFNDINESYPWLTITE